MSLGELRRTSVFRLTLLFSLLLIGSVLLLFGFVYWRTAALLERRFDEQLASEAREIARTPPEAQAMALDNLIVSDPHEDWRGGLFDKTGQRLSGNINIWPQSVVIDGKSHDIDRRVLGQHRHGDLRGLEIGRAHV